MCWKEPLAVERFVLHRLIGAGLPAPRAEHYERLDDTEYLILSALPGKNLAEMAEDHALAADLAVDLMAGAITRIHAARPRWPEDINSLTARLEMARARVRGGLVDEDDFEPEHAGMKPEEILARFDRGYREPAARVFVHGDLCLPNVLADGGALSGLVDWSRAGYGDPYQDLALAARSLAHNLGPGDWARRLARACGIADLDEERLQLWVLFDELF